MDPAAHPGLAALGYSRRWLDLGLLSVDVLDGQLALFRSGTDPATGSYRFGAFVEAVQNLPLTDTRVTELLEVARLDSDASASREMLTELLRQPGLSDTAFESVAAACGWKEQRRYRVLRELRRIGPTPVVLERCLATRDGDVHEALLGVPELPRAYVEELAEHGAWRRVRNAAAARLKQRAA